VAVKQLIDEAYQRAKALLSERRALLNEGARLLLEKETLTPDDFPALAGAKGIAAESRLKELA
jgi:cell division protease FtsH